jgi:hypothetical protein
MQLQAPNRVSNLVNATADTLPQKAATNQQVSLQNSLRLSEVDDTVIENRLVELALAQPNYDKLCISKNIRIPVEKTKKCMA